MSAQKPAVGDKVRINQKKCMYDGLTGTGVIQALPEPKECVYRITADTSYRCYYENNEFKHTLAFFRDEFVIVK